MSSSEIKREIIERVMDAVMAGSGESITGHFAPGARFQQRNNAAAANAAWFDRMEGDFPLKGPDETRAFFDELIKRTSYLTYELLGIICEGDEGASRCEWTRRDDETGTLVTGTTMYWFSFTSDGRIRSIETVGSIHSVIPLRRRPSSASVQPFPTALPSTNGNAALHDRAAETG